MKFACFSVTLGKILMKKNSESPTYKNHLKLYKYNFCHVYLNI